MKARRLTWALCLLLLTSMIQIPSLMADNEMPGEGDLTRVRKKVQALRAWQLTEVLNLDEETSSQLFPAMRKTDQERWKVEARNRELVREMARSLEQSDHDPQKIDSFLDELLANRRELIRAEERHLEKVRQILSPEDTARYFMFQIRFQREIKRKAAQAYRERRQSNDDMDRGSRDRSPDDGGRGGGGFGGDDRGGYSGGGGKGR